MKHSIHTINPDQSDDVSINVFLNQYEKIISYINKSIHDEEERQKLIDSIDDLIDYLNEIYL